VVTQTLVNGSTNSKLIRAILTEDQRQHFEQLISAQYLAQLLKQSDKVLLTEDRIRKFPLFTESMMDESGLISECRIHQFVS